MTEKNQEVARSEARLAIQASPCWAKGKEIFLISLLQSSKPPSKADIDKFMKENGSLNSTISSCQKLQTSSDSSYNSGRGGKFMTKLISTLSVIKEVADPFLSFAPESVSIAWFAISTLIQIGAADAQNCELISDACNNVASILLTCRIYETRYQEASYAPSEKRMGDAEIEQKIMAAIPDIIALILDFSWYVKNLLGGHRIVRVLKATFSTSLKEKVTGMEEAYAGLRTIAGDAFQERIMDSMEGIFKTMQKDQEELRALLFPSLDEIKKRLGDVSAVKNAVELSALRKDFQQARNDLRPSNTHLQQFQATFDPVSRHADHICQWLFADPHYKRWEHLDGLLNDNHAESDLNPHSHANDDEGSPNLFFVQAHPGFGKSVTLASVVRRLSETNEAILAYFFFKQGNDDTQTSLRALTSIATQLCNDRFAKNEDELVKLMAVVKQLNPLAGGAKEESSEGEPKQSSNATIFTIDMLKTTIRNVGTNLRKKIYIVLDGMDECIDHDTEELVPFLLELSRTGFFKILFSSRENKDLEQLVVSKGASDTDTPPQQSSTGCIITNKTVLLNITEDRTSADMEIFLTSSLKRIMEHRSRGYKSKDIIKADMLQIVKNIQRKAKGMFTYAAIVIASLELPSQMTLAQKLMNLPKGMDDLYRQRLESLNTEEKKLVVTALKYIVWGLGKVSTIEIAEQFKRIYENIPVEGESVSNGEMVFNPFSAEKLAPGAVYDALTDPEVAETVYHLAQSGRDFFKFSNQQREIDIVHKTVRDWVENEAKKITQWQQTVAAHAPKIGVSKDGVLKLDLPLPPGLVSSGDGTSIELQSERDAHLDIAINSLTVLSHPKFAQRYLGGPAPEDLDSTPNNQVDDAISNIEEEVHLIHAERSMSFSVPQAKATTYRYESLHWLDHVRELQELWPNKEDRQTPQWTVFWDVFSKFINSSSYRLWLSQFWQAKHGFSVEWSQRDDMYLPPLHLTVKEGLGILADYLLNEAKADPDTKDGKGDTAIHHAMEHPKILKLLLDRGASIDTKSHKNATLLQKTLYDLFMVGWIEGQIPPPQNMVDVAILLIEKGANIKEYPEIPNPGDFRTPLQIAASIKALPLFELLMKHPENDVNMKDPNNMSALNWVHMNFNQVSLSPTITVSIVKALLEAGADPNNQSIESMGPLTPAVIAQDKESVELLLDYGADINDDTTEGLTALHVACGTMLLRYKAETAVPIVRLLLMNGADLEREGNDGRPALHFAAASGFEKTFRILIREYERKYGEDRSYLVKEYGEGKHTVLQAVARNTTDGLGILKYLTELWTPEVLKEQIQKPGSTGRLAVHWAAELGNYKVLKILLENGADIYPMIDGNTALDIAFYSWSQSKSEADSYTDDQIEDSRSLEETCVLLLDMAPDLVTKSRANLRWAAEKGSVRLAKKLLECGADPEYADAHGWTPYEFAVASKQVSVMKDIPEFSSWADPGRTVRETTIPSVLSAVFDTRFIIAEDGLSFHTPPEFVIDDDSTCIVSNHPLAAHLPVFYWEITISETERPAADFMIGFISDHVPPNTCPGYTISLNGDSFSMQGLDGKLLAPRESKHATLKVSLRTYYTPQGEVAFGAGDTVGCGYSNETGVIFYTLNGRYLGPAFQEVWGRWHPAFGCFEKCKGKVNFGAEPFMYEDMRTYWEKTGMNKLVAELAEKELAKRAEEKAANEKAAAEKAAEEEAAAEKATEEGLAGDEAAVAAPADKEATAEEEITETAEKPTVEPTASSGQGSQQDG